MFQKKPLIIFLFLFGFALLWFLVSNFFVGLEFSSSEKETKYVDPSTSLDCKGVYEASPLCIERNEALSALKAFTKKLELVIQKNIQSDEINSANRLKKEGDLFYFDEYFYKARDSYLSGTNILKKELEKSERNLENILNEGKRLFNQKKLMPAKKAFQDLLEKDPDNEVALIYLSKIKVYPEVESLIKMAIKERDKFNFKLSLQYLNDALNLDSEFPRLDLIIKKTQELEKNYLFNRYLNQGFTEISNKNINKAINSFKLAKNLKPKNKDLFELEQEISRVLKEINLSRYIERGKLFFSKEEWRKAAQNFESALEINSNLKEIINLLNESKKYALSYEEMDFYLKNEKRLSSDKIYENALIILKEAREISNQKYNLFNGQIKKLKDLIEKYSTKVEVNISSNRKTFLEIERAQKFKPFSEKKLLLRPGEYVFIVKRSGMTSLRKTINVDFKKQVLFLSANCEKICKLSLN